MFIYNIKINNNKLFKLFFITVIILLICIVSIVIFRVFNGASKNPKNSEICQISTTNYTNVLKAVHDNIDAYVGIKIHFSGYVYKLFDFNENQFVLARNMVISSNFQTVVVGFLCESENIKDFADNSWVELTGEITKGDYHGDMPIIKVTELKSCDKPNDELVYPPDENYIPVDGKISYYSHSIVAGGLDVIS